MPLVTGVELARDLGCTGAAISQALKAGRLHYAEGRLFDLDAARRDWEANRRRSRSPLRSAARPAGKSNGGHGTPNAGVERLLAARIKREEAIAERAELELLQYKGTLVVWETATRTWIDQCVSVRENLLGLADRIAAGAAHALGAANPEGVRIVAKYLDDEIRIALRAWNDARLKELANVKNR